MNCFSPREDNTFSNNAARLHPVGSMKGQALAFRLSFNYAFGGGADPSAGNPQARCRS
jgi:hypothetical protein